MTSLRPLGPGTVHVVVDMQRLFAEPGDWMVPDLPSIVGNVAALAAAHPERTLFTRFVTPETAEDAQGWWRHYYRHWAQFTRARLAPGMLDVIADLAAYARPGAVFDKPTYSAFESPDFCAALTDMRADALVVTGVETDVCALGTIMAAMDRGYRVVAARDALASSSSAGHAATLDHILPRCDQQIEIAETAAILAAWTKS